LTQDIQGAAHAISYEITQLDDALTYRTRVCSGGREPSLARLLLEVFLLHDRNLRDFFEREPNHDDVVAKDFSDDWLLNQWPDHVNDQRSAKDDRYSERKLINKLLAHITYFRGEIRSGSPAEISWPLPAMFATTRSEFLKFVALLPVDERKWFAECASTLSAVAPAVPPDGVSNSTETRGPFIKPFSRFR